MHFSNIDEVPEKSISQFVEKRNSQIANTQGIGPIDICVLDKIEQKSGFISKFTRKTVYTASHQVFGVDCSSLSAIAAYLSHFQEFISGSTKIVLNQAIFCSYDIFSKQDIRSYYSRQGQMQAKAVDFQGYEAATQDIHWKGACISSVLRYLYHYQSIGTRVLEWPKDHQNMRDFFTIARQFMPQLGFVIGNLWDVIRYQEHLLFPSMSEFLIRRRMLELHYQLFSAVVKDDPLMLSYISDAYIVMRRSEDALATVAEQLSVTPHAIPLLLRQAKALLQLSRFQQALNVSIILIQLSPEHFDCWEILAQCYLKQKMYSKVLICLNQAPVYDIEPYDTNQPLNIFSSNSILWDSHPLYAFEPKRYDFRPFESQDNTTSKLERMIIQNLDSLPGSKLTPQIKRIYNILVQLEREIGWDNLLKLRQGVFLMEGERDPNSQDLYENNPLYYNSDDILLEIDNKDHGERGQIQGTAGSPKAPQQPQVMWTPRQNQEAPDPTPRSHLFGYENRTQISRNRSKRICSQMLDHLFTCFFYDLSSMFEWQAENQDWDRHAPGQKSDAPYSGILWVKRGDLAERLMRSRFSEQAYRHCIDKGFSLYSWSRLIKLYIEAGNPKAVLVCFVEILKQMQADQVDIQNSVKFIQEFPPWMNEAFSQTCTTCGIRHLTSLVQELKLDRYNCVVKAIERLYLWRVEGSIE